ncbi:hypothetical protein D3C85_1908870 [compost metagenome]
MMLDPGKLFRRRFGRTDIHPAVHLHRISGNDFRVVFFGQRQAKLGFADGGRADQYKQLRPMPVRFCQHRITP